MAALNSFYEKVYNHCLIDGKYSQKLEEEYFLKTDGSMVPGYHEWKKSREASEEKARIIKERGNRRQQARPPSDEELLKTLKELRPDTNPRYSGLDDLSNARLYADMFRKGLGFNTTRKSYDYYDGRRWTRDPESMRAEGYAKELARALFSYSLDTGNGDYMKHVQRLGQRRQRKIMIEDARDLMHISSSDYDTNPALLNCLNCVLDLDKLEAMPHNPELRLSKLANVNYEPKADTAIWDNFIDAVMMGDKDKTRYLQTKIGYVLTGSNELEQADFIVGGGRNGKSVFAETISFMMGDYAAHIAPESLAQRQRSGGAANGDIARLAGIRFVLASEPAKRMLLDESLFKTLTGRDTITARDIYEKFFDFRPAFKLFLNANHLPIISDPVVFTSGRVNVIRFERTFSEEEQDKTLKDKLRDPAVLSGVLLWAIKGLKDYRENGLIVPECVKIATAEYQEASDKLGNFIAECLQKDPDSNITAKSAYNVYKVWCSDNGLGIDSKRNFFSELRARNMLVNTATVNGRTEYNVIVGYRHAGVEISPPEYDENPFE